jgi:hypothetical protein
MNLKKIMCVISMLLALTFFVPCQIWAQALFPYEGGGQIKTGTQAPIITHSFAVERGFYGYIWKIYIEAEDSDGDMLRIASVVDQVGYGHYPTDWIFLKKEYGQHFKGYIQWNTSSSRTSYLSEWTLITLSVSIFDRAGNESNVIVFPFTFGLGKGQYEDKPVSPFDRGELPRLGYIHIDLFDPNQRYDHLRPPFPLLNLK